MQARKYSINNATDNSRNGLEENYLSDLPSGGFQLPANDHLEASGVDHDQLLSASTMVVTAFRMRDEEGLIASLRLLSDTIDNDAPGAD